MAVFAVAAAVLAGRLLGASQAAVQIALLHAAVALAVWYGGAVPGLLATALGGLAASLLFIGTGATQPGAGLLGYLISCSLIVALGHSLRAARARAFVDRGARLYVEQALRTSERNFQLVFELAAVGAAQVEPTTGRFVRVNQRLCELTGYSEAELLERTYSEITHPDDRLREVEAVDAASQDEQSAWQIEKRYVRKDGSTVWVLVTGRTIRDGEGRLVRTAAHILDLTARRETEQAMRRSEARYRALVEAISSVVWSWNPETMEGDYARVQAWWEEVTGQSPAEQNRNGWLESVHPDDRSQAHAMWTGALRTGTPYEVEYRVRTRTGEYRHLWCRAVPSNEGVVAGREWVGMVTDVTEQQRAKEALRHGEELLRLIIDAVPALISYIGADYHYLLVNRSYERWFGLLPEQIQGRHVRDLIGDQAWRAVEGYLRRALAGEDVAYEQEIDYREVGRRWVRSTCTPDRDHEGRVRGMVVLVNDITERKHIEDALKEADRRKDEFLATLAHELRNPLAPIRSSLQLLKMPAADPAVQQRARDMMERQLHHLVRLVDDLLDVSRIMRGKIELRTDRLALDTVIARALETVQPLIDGQRHTLVVALPPRPVLLQADPVRLAQVVSNLLANAAKYTEPGGHIRLAVERSGSDALIRVSDDGIGIAPDMRARIFDLFVQVDHSTSRAQGGLGIGLTLVKSLVEMHHGSIEVHSPGLGEGSEFIVRLPALPDEQAPGQVMDEQPRPGPQAPADEQAGPRADAPGPGRQEPDHSDHQDGKPGQPGSASHGRVLVVDDNTDAAETLAMLLQLYGYEVEVADGGRAALALIPAFRPGVIFLDIGMPDMDGYEVARRVRELPAGKHVCLVALTGWGQAEDRRRTREAGFDHHFIKPIAPEAVRELLTRVFEGSQAPASPAAP